MKLLIASDIHGSAYWARRLMEAIDAEQPDRIALLGDLLYHGPRNDLPRDYAPKEVIPLLNSLAPKVVAVRGNCEAEVDQMVLDFPCMADYAQLYDAEAPAGWPGAEGAPGARGKLLHLSHGHVQTPERHPKLPAGSAFVSGHTHVKVNELAPEGDVWLFNPGSVGIPKDGSHSYGVYEDGAFSYRILGEPGEW